MGDNMRKTSLLLILAALLANPSRGQSVIEAPKTKLETTIVQDFFDLYRMRGLDFSTGPVSQTNLVMNYGNLAGIVLVNHNFDRGHIDEYDFVGRYTDTLNVTIAGAKPIVFGQFVYLDMARQQAGKSKEAAVVATLPVTLNPTLTFAKDFDKGKGEYFGLTIGQDGVVSIAGVPISVWGTIGYNNKYWNSTATWSHADAMVKAPIALGNGWTATPNITYSSSLNKEYFSNATVAGLQISKSF